MSSDHDESIVNVNLKQLAVFSCPSRPILTCLAFNSDSLSRTYRFTELTSWMGREASQLASWMTYRCSAPHRWGIFAGHVRHENGGIADPFRTGT